MTEKNPILHRVLLTDMADKGMSMGKAEDGCVVFVPKAAPGDVIDVAVKKRKKRFYQGIPVYFHKYSEKRATPICRHFGICGGCKWQHLEYAAQLEFKQKEVQDRLNRIGGLRLPVVLPILGTTKIYHYRNKMEFSFSNSRWLTDEEIQCGQSVLERQALGFHLPGRWDKVLDLQECHLQGAPSEEIRLAIKAYATQQGWSFYDLRGRKGFLRTLLIRISSIGEIMILIQFSSDDEAKRRELFGFLKERFPQITSLLYIINSKSNDSIYDCQVKCFSGRSFIYEEMGGLRFKIDAKSFYQTHSQQAHTLYKVVRDFAALSGDEIVYDLYTGIGTIAQFVAARARKVIGLESVPESIALAEENARLNAIDNCVFFCGDMKAIFTPDFIATQGCPDVVIADPPREGMHKKVVETLLRIKPRRIVYVSCNSATQARDLALMKERYILSKAQPVDMFPQTHHVENVALLERKE